MAIIMNLILICLLGLAAAGTFRLNLGKVAPIEVYSANAGVSGVTYHFYVENDSSVEAGNYLSIKFPSQYTDIGLTSPCHINNVSIACTKVGTNYVRIQLASRLAPLTRLDIRVPGITNPSSAGGTGFFEIFTQFIMGSQIIDRNEKLSTIGLQAAPLAASITITRATGGSAKVGGSFNLVVGFTTGAEIASGSTIRVGLPSEFTLSTSFACTAVVSGSAAAIIGPFTCTYSSIDKAMVITGLSKTVAAGYACAISISSFTNPLYVLSAAASTYTLDILKPNTMILTATGTASSLEVTAGTIDNVTHEPYYSGAQLTESNILFTKLSFSVTNPVPEGGTILIDYGLHLDVDDAQKTGCWAMSGINPKADGTQPTCAATDGASTVTLSNFGAIAAGGKVVIVNRLELTTSSLTKVDITTKDASPRVIDDDNNAQGGLTIVAKPTITDGTVTYVSDSKAGSLNNINIFFKPNADLVAGAMIKIYMPKGFVLPSNAAAKCIENVGADLTLITCSLTGYTLTTVTLSAVTALSGVTLKLQSTGTPSGWTFPSLPSSIDNPYEWEIEVYPSVTSTALSCFGSLIQVVTPLTFDVTTGNTAVTAEIMSPNQYVPYSFVLKIDRALTTTSTMIPVIRVDFSTKNTAGTSNTFPIDLGTGLTSEGAIACKIISGLTSLSSAAPLTCTLTPAALASSTNFATVTITKFKDIPAGTLVKFKLFVKNCQTASLSDIPIKVSTLTMTYNAITTILQTESFAFATTAAVTGGFTTKTLTSRTSKVIMTSTNVNLSVRLSRATSSVDGDKLVIRFPPGWVFNDSQGFSVGANVAYNTEVYNNAYSPTIIGSLSTAGKLNGSSGADLNIMLENLTNLGYGDRGAGAISLGFVDATTAPASPEYVDIGTTATSLDATEGANFVATIETNSLSRLAADVTYTFVITTAYDIPAGGNILVVFPAGFDPTYSTCKTTSTIKDQSSTLTKLCSVNSAGLSATVSQIAALPKKSTFRLIVYTVKNPDVATTGTFKVYTLYDSDTTHVIEKQETGLTLALTAQLNPAELSVSKYTMYPTSTNSVADLMIDFTLNANVPKAGVLTVTLPGGFTLPSLDSTNCILTFMYSSCSRSGTVITLVPMLYFPAGYKLSLIIPGVVVPSSDVKNNPVSFKATWNGLTIIQNPSKVPSSFYFAPTTGSTTAITASVKVWPKNVAEVTTHEFTLKLPSGLASSLGIIIWLPVEYPSSGMVQCWSSMAMHPSTMLACRLELNQSITIFGFNSVAIDKEFKIKIVGIINPTSIGTTSSFRIASLNPNDNSVVDSLSTGLTTDVVSAPGLLEVYNVTASVYSTGALSDYTVVAKTTNTMASNQGEVWLGLSDYDYKTEVSGLGYKYNCSAEGYENKAFKSVYSSYNCTDDYHNFIALRGTHAQVAGDYLRATYRGVKNPTRSGRMQPLVLSTYDVSNMRVIDKSYSTAAANNVMEMEDNTLMIYIDSFQGNLTVRPNVVQTFTIFTESSSLPFKQAMTLTPMLITYTNMTGVTFIPNIIQLPKGKSRTTFDISVAATAIQGDYVILWKLGGDTGKFYSEPVNSLLKVTSDFKYTITLDTIPTILVNTTVPLNIYLPVAPINGFTVNMTTEAGISASPVSFLPGQMQGSFNLTVAGVSQTNSRLNMTLIGVDADAYTLKSASVFFYITKYDDEPPYLDSFVINDPRDRLSLDVTIQTTESCYFYYLFGERGLNEPVNTTLITNALNGKSTKTETYGYVFVGGSLMHKLTFKDLQEEKAYVLYGYLQDTFDRVIDGVFMFNLDTDEMDNTVTFQLQFTGTQPTESQLNGDVLNVLRTQFGLLTPSLLSYVSSKSRRLDTVVQPYTFELKEEETDNFVAPIDLVKANADAYALASAFAAYNLTLDTSFMISSTIKTDGNDRPTWIIYPYVIDSTVNATSATLICNVDTVGMVYLQVLGSDAFLPSSRQVTEELGPFNEKADMVYKQPSVYNKTLTFQISGLNSTSSYVVMVTAINSDPIKPRVMREDVMASLVVITGAPPLVDDSSRAAMMFAVSTVWLLLSWL
jgi:hypothetical protein